LTNFRPPCEIYGELTFRFRLPGSDDELAMKGVLVWVEANGTAGVRFTDVSELSSNLLRDWIAGQQRTAPRR
jgi:PilZ domain